jgi:Bacterial membrane protein YfhO
VSTATLARRYGVTFVLEPGRAPGTEGGIYEVKIGDEDLYRIPGAGAATLNPPAGDRCVSGLGRAGRAAGSHPSRSSKLETRDVLSQPTGAPAAAADVPGWHATIDGRPLRLDRFSGVMFQARIPAGRHVLQLYYWPTAFTVGSVLAASSVAGLLLALVVGSIRRRRQPTSASLARGAT